jgi:hypothetical protein
VRTVPYHEATGELKSAFDQISQARGTISNVHAVSSMRPHPMKTLFAHNRSVVAGESGLSPAGRQMIATVVSNLNHCQY